ncbi:MULTISPECIES: M15 family metallopeptidase [Bacillus]|jgi:zinc D-Ala-D-Ala carboxypeptidase|uniref:Carboxypeptidase YodJ n=1 Tax=Bacillus safensis TaxID=561879 RepID=A0A498TZA3_BACIA|nr:MULTISPECIES: M15 family metallopeptidase [Bacillus]MBK4211945.1 D-alanyl-D-alanine carboxypeptidase family protein [Bacillus pumilus]MBY0190846.1 M15 family metallopeptidase [Bacillus aerophilus]PNU24516.1 peptidase M15 [Bacillus stratosphericus]APJ11380.1 peptidase M15 [Bacillus safensis]AWI37042.1 peptidase M15 [Bacillus safensis FO-36b]
MKKSYKILSIASILGLTAALSGCQLLDQKSGTSESNKTNEQKNAASSSPQHNSNDKADSSNQELTLKSEYFNDIKVVSGLKTIQNPENVLALVNKEYALPGTYKPSDLVVPKVEFSFSEDIEKRYIRKEAAEALEKLFKGAKKENFELAAVSGYRSYDRQKVIFDSEVKLKGKEKAQEAVALPGESEHQTGLAMDISSKSAGFEISEKFGETPDGKWVAKNAYKYGFIIRYPKGKEDITKYEYEPWHLRYVGKEAAKAMHDHDLTFEEYMNKVKKI